MAVMLQWHRLLERMFSACAQTGAPPSLARHTFVTGCYSQEQEADTCGHFHVDLGKTHRPSFASVSWLPWPSCALSCVRRSPSIQPAQCPFGLHLSTWDGACTESGPYDICCLNERAMISLTPSFPHPTPILSDPIIQP